MRGLDAHYAGPPEDPAWEAWCANAKAGDACEIVGHHDGTATDCDGNATTLRGGNVTGEILAINDDRVTVHGSDGLTYTLDRSDVGPVTGY